MSYRDESFTAADGLERALELLRETPGSLQSLPDEFPNHGAGESEALYHLAPHVLGKAARLGSAQSLAHMDPPTPWITWATALWNASLNQNLLHESTSPFATEAEERVIDWLAPFFGMQGGHFCAGSSVANLTSLWAARDAKNIRKVVASESAHVSIAKAANILGLEFERLPVDAEQRLDPDTLGNLDDACLVLTAGTTATGSIDPLHLAGSAGWTHIDAAWAGPLRLSERYAHLLAGIEEADSVAVSAHKWLFQPKDSAIVFFSNMRVANAPISFGGTYLAKPNIGVQGSRGAAAIPLLATLMAWGREGVACRIEQTMSIAGELAANLQKNADLIVWNKPETAINVFRPVSQPIDQFMRRVPNGMFSTCSIAEKRWLRSVAANPMANIDLITQAVFEACRS